ncbi:amidohydrolase [Mesobacillus maritimus]|uniref:amidohydrolase n=1 Tax=Mesobacillus maritimus TaxID=1643336 RepID=UPI00204114F1|nr:amidohydrolase [Mesobacillus maritimus]MCM3584313.1 amidohydrolase [Mesobacillus maritimus]MCM3669270.1 amidohydrolase [Mesobacillus maritimus]
MNPMQFIDDYQTFILNTYKELHKLAEPSWKEEKTSRYLQEILIDAGLYVQAFKDHYGFIAEIRGEKPEVIALRADLDALVQEKNGVICANHSCGHDAHSTMVMMTAIALSKMNTKFSYTIRFIFQPAEELAGGALQMMKDGALDNVKFLGGIHLRPAFEVEFGKAAPVILHGSTTTLKGTIKGAQAHAARPEDGNNPIEAASLLIQAIKQIRLPADVGGYSIKITELQSGVASNAIPETAHFTFDLRSERNEGMTVLIEKTKHTVDKIAELTETDIHYHMDDEFSPAAVKNIQAVTIAEKAIGAILGKEKVVSECVSPGAEDFHFYTMKNPDLAATMIGLGCGLAPGLHHPDMSFDHQALIYGTKILTKMMLEADQQSWV